MGYIYYKENRNGLLIEREKLFIIYIKLIIFILNFKIINKN